MTTSSITRACQVFARNDRNDFDIGYLHGLAWTMDYDTEWQTIKMLIDCWQGTISMEG